ncbi:MAG: hypothetical protein MUO52_06320 [Desulfobacterales bacterium]|nr:hypothetical protein [Desulfobacterales bacterium]
MIPERVVEEVWREVGAFDASQAHKEMMKLGKRQPDLLAFVTAFDQDLDREAMELAIYIFFVVYRMFEKGSTKKIKMISAEEIEKCWQETQNLMKRLGGAHNKFFDRAAEVLTSRQPYVMKYVTEAIIEAPDVEDPVALTEEDTGPLFLLLKTVVDVLDKKTEFDEKER